ncbi:unnamed protein product [Closterium sp. NIES-54]
MRCCPLHPQFDLIFASQLRHVTIESLTSGVSLESLSHLTSLEQLDVKYGTGSFPVGLFALPSLTFVKLGYVKWMEGGDTHWDWDFERDGYIYPAAEKAAAAIAARDVRYPPLGHNCTLLPASLDRLHNLRSLSLSGRFKYFPPSLAFLASTLESLTLYFSRKSCRGYYDLISLPVNFGTLISLKNLSIEGWDKFHHLPDSFSALASLVHLTVTDCQTFSTLPDGFGSLPRLTQLEISRCDSFTHLPFSFTSLPLLRVACFSLCKQLHSLPPHMGQMLRLEVLQLRECVALKSLPNSPEGAEALRSVDVCGSGLDQEGGEVKVCGRRVHVVRRTSGKAEK